MRYTHDCARNRIYEYNYPWTTKQTPKVKKPVGYLQYAIDYTIRRLCGSEKDKPEDLYETTIDGSFLGRDNLW